MLPSDELHDDEGRAFEFVDLVNHSDMRMLEFGSGFGLLDETAFPLGVGDELGKEDFDGHLAVEIQVDGAIYDPHTATADLGFDLVVRERPADQWSLLVTIRIHRHFMRQVKKVKILLDRFRDQIE